MSENYRHIYCPNCGAENDASYQYCHDCGQPLYEHVKQKESINGLCLAGMIVGIVSIFFCSILIPAIVGLVLSIVGFRQTVKGERNRTFALVGIITSAVSLALFLLVIIVFGALIGSLASASYYF